MEPSELTPEEMTPEEIAIMREQVAAELDAEESGEPIKDVQSETVSGDAGDIDAKTGDGEDHEEKETDPWDGVNPALKAQFDAMSSQLESFKQTEYRLKQAESRIGSLTNRLHEVTTARQKAETDEPTAPTKDQMEKAAKSKEAWEELEEDFPEWATAIDGRLAEIREEVAKKGGTITQEQVDAAIQDATTGLERQFEIRILKRFHPDYETVKESQDFQTWINAQPEEIKAKTRSDSAEDAITVLDAYKVAYQGNGSKSKTASEIAEERRQRLARSTVPEGRKARAPKSEAEMNEPELRKKIGREVWAE